jgi:ATP adenylyltransferase
VTLERLWAGWRADYLEAAGAGPETTSDHGCLFCGLGEADARTAFVLARDEHVYAVLNAYPYTSGHLMVVPRRHVADLEVLVTEEAHALIEMPQRAITALKIAYGPDGVNIGMNLGRAAGAGIPGHLHMHVVPRWSGDTNFMTAVAEARVLPESLGTTYERLRGAWPA